MQKRMDCAAIDLPLKNRISQWLQRRRQTRTIILERLPDLSQFYGRKFLFWKDAAGDKYKKENAAGSGILGGLG